MRKVRGAQRLSDYLKSINCPISRTTIQELMKVDGIPYHKPSPRVLIFDLDEIDAWLNTSRKEG